MTSNFFLDILDIVTGGPIAMLTTFFFIYETIVVNLDSTSWFPCVPNKMGKKVKYPVGCHPTISKQEVYLLFIIAIDSS